MRSSIVCSVDSTAPLPEGLQSPKPEIPDKLYFRIGDVSRLAGVKAYVLRYWESEFPAIAPKKSGTGQRLYRRKDVELILEIKHLLYEKRFTIEGARKAIENRVKPVPAAKRAKAAGPMQQANLFGAPAPDLSAIRRELEEILRLLKK
jgi:DNA-binding transcriptional MerR regulator